MDQNCNNNKKNGKINEFQFTLLYNRYLFVQSFFLAVCWYFVKIAKITYFIKYLYAIMDLENFNFDLGPFMARFIAKWTKQPFHISSIIISSDRQIKGTKNYGAMKKHYLYIYFFVYFCGCFYPQLFLNVLF